VPKAPSTTQPSGEHVKRAKSNPRDSLEEDEPLRSVSQPERPEGAGQGQDDPAKVRQPYFLPSFFLLT
jgi:hypothetical protein